MSTMLLSIKPQYAKMILTNEKVYEFRKRRCKDGIDKIVFYATAPQSEVVGEARIERIIEGSPTAIWDLAKHQAGITRKNYRAYYSGCHHAIAYQLTDVVVYDPPKKLSDYEITHVPQSFVYID